MAEKRPRWYLTKTTWQSAVTGGGWALIGLAGLVLYLLGAGHVGYLIFSMVLLALGGIYLASALARYRRERSRNDSTTAE